MPFADSNRADVRAIPEVTWGTTPSSGTSRQVRYTSHDIVGSKETQVSNEIRSDRMVPSIAETGAGTGGTLNFEFSAGAQDPFMESYLGGTWTRPMTMDEWTGNVSFTGTAAITIAGGDYTLYFTTGRRLKTENFVNPANNNYWTISSVAFTGGNTVITTSETTGVIEASNLRARLCDANDVIILRSTAIRAGTSGASAFDSNSTNAFASAISAGQIVVGQKLFVEHSAAYETGTVVFTGTGATGDTVTITDGVNSIAFIGGTNFTIGASASATATNLAAAINAARAAGTLNCAATVSTGTVTVRNLNVSGGTITETVDAGAAFSVTNFTGAQAGVRGVFTVTAATSDVITVTPAPPTVASGTVTIKGSMLRNPSDPTAIVNRSWTLETHFTDIARQFASDGLRVGQFSMNFQAGEIVTGSVQMTGREHKKVATRRLALSPYTALAAPTAEVTNATSNVAQITKNGVALATAVQTLSFQGEAGLREQKAVGSKFNRGIGLGRLSITGSLNAYFEDTTMYDHFKAHDTVSLGWTTVDLDSNRYDFTLPAVKITSDNIVPSGIDQDVMEEMEFSVQRDPLLNCEMQIDRFSSVAAI